MSHRCQPNSCVGTVMVVDNGLDLLTAARQGPVFSENFLPFSATYYLQMAAKLISTFQRFAEQHHQHMVCWPVP